MGHKPKKDVHHQNQDELLNEFKFSEVTKFLGCSFLGLISLICKKWKQSRLAIAIYKINIQGVVLALK